MTKRTIATLALCLSATVLAAEQEMPLPPGHPEIAHPSPSSMPESAIGTLRIHAQQKTADGPSLQGQKAIVHFYQGDKVIKHVDAVLDANGEATVGDIPLTRNAVQALVMVPYGNITYQAVSHIMNSAMTEAKVEVPVYETTRDIPEWKIAMRHLMISHTSAGVRVVDMLAVDNPSDRTWIGTNEHEEGTTLILKLPPGAGNIEIGDGFTEHSLHFHNGTIYNVAPMTPGMTHYSFGYTIPVKSGKVEIPINTPALTQQLIVFAPNDGSEIKANGLLEQGTRKTDGGEMRMFSGVALMPGQPSGLTISGLANTPAAVGGGWSTAQVVAASALGVVLLGGIGFMLLKPVKPKAEN